jgi:protein-disulfide isomerase
MVMVMVCVFMCVKYPVVVAQQHNPPSIVDRLNTLEKTVQNVNDRLSELTLLLKSMFPSPIEDITTVELPLAGMHTRGSASATVAIVEFADFECPFCRQHAKTVYRDLVRQLVDTGKALYVFRNLPIERIHANSIKAAEAGECAADQGKFWEYHDRLFDEEIFRLSNLRQYAQGIDLDAERFDACINDGEMASRVRNDIAEATRLGVTGTPTFFVGERKGETVVAKKRIVGSQPLAVLRGALDGVLPK